MPLEIFYVIEDADGGKSRIPLYLQETNITFANAPAVLEYVWNLLNPLVTGSVVTAGFTLTADISGWTNLAADVLSDVQERAEFAFRTVGGFLKRIGIPTFAETKFGGGGASGDVNTADTDVAAFTAACIGGFPQPDDSSNVIFFQDSHGDDLNELATAHESWGKGRR